MPTRQELQLLQALPLELKIMKTKQRVREWVGRFGVDGVYVSFSGGKDSTVLLHIVREIYPDIEAVFVDTGLEYPEIRQFVKGFENVTWLRPKMSFVEVIKKYGYPIISKDVAQCIYEARKGQRHSIERLNGTLQDKNWNLSPFNISKWKPLIFLPFQISHKCCDIMKKEPVKKYEKKTGEVGITGQMAEESFLRLNRWLQVGCNAFNAKRPISNPLSFWTNQDILQYIKENNLEISEVYGEVVDSEFLKNGQICCEGCETWKTTGCYGTGCVFCLFGMHLEKGESRLQRLHRTHPKLYDYCMNGGEFVLSDYYVEITNKKQLGKILRQITRLKYKVTTKRQDYLCIRLSNGELKKVKLIWQPNKKGLGMKFVCDEVNRVMGKELLRY